MVILVEERLRKKGDEVRRRWRILFKERFCR